MFQVASEGGKHKDDEMTPLREAKQLAATGVASQKSVKDMALAAAWTAMAHSTDVAVIGVPAVLSCKRLSFKLSTLYPCHHEVFD
jgi:hypothetical protein